MARQDLDLNIEAMAPAKKSGAMKWILIGMLMLSLLGGATVGTLYFAGVIGDTTADASTTGGKNAKKGPQIYLAMDPAFVVNFDATASVRFMQIALQVAARDPAIIESVKEHTPAIRNGLVMLYSSQDPVALNTRAGKEALLQESLDEINRVLTLQTGSAGVENVYFTSFVMQ
ncbi:MAG: flagellar basal body-associated FliL family protein [Thiohalobacteraceae bacterium]